MNALKHGKVPDWYVQVDGHEQLYNDLGIEHDGEIWIHVKDAAYWCVEDVQYGYAGDIIPGTIETFSSVEPYLGPRPLEVDE